MEFITDYRVERYALDTKWQDLPEKVQEWAKMCGIDLMSALVLGSYGRQFAAGTKLAQTVGLSGEIPVVGDEQTYNLLGAAIAMGHSSNSFDIDDGFRMIQGHPGTSFVGGVLAAALKQGVTCREYLTTLVICYELSIRWAFAMQDHYKYLHSTGAYGAYGTAAGVGRLLGLDEKQLNTALSIADFHAPMTPVMRAVEFPSMNKDGVPFGALVGTMAVLETLSGSTGKTHLLEMPEYGKFLDDLGEKFHILDLYFKPYTCCRWAHQPILGIQKLMAQHHFTNDDVEHVKVNTFLSAARLSKIQPSSTDEAQYNIAWPVASALVYGDVGYQQVREEALNNGAVLEAMKKLEFAVDPELDKLFPAQRLANVEITLTDGTVLKSETYEAPGECDDPELGLEWIMAKFKRVTASMLDSADQDAFMHFLTEDLDAPVADMVAKINASLKKNI